MTVAESPPSRYTQRSPVGDLPTVWGLDAIQLHDYYWAARGVQVVRLGERSTVVEGAELFLLTDDRTLLLMRVRPLLDILSWIAPTVLLVRVHDTRALRYREHAMTGPDGVFRRFDRSYAQRKTIAARVALTADPDIARAWQAMGDTPWPWRSLRRHIPVSRRETSSVSGHLYQRHSMRSLDTFIKDLVRLWPQPSAVVTRAARHSPNVWADTDSRIPASSRLIGGVWIGAGRQVNSDDLIVGPAVLWDDPQHRPVVETIQWRDIEPTEAYTNSVQITRRSSISRIFKRLFDMLFSLIAIIITLPIYPIVMVAIFLEDGFPFFFTHKRETLGGREFPCLKFRSMRKDAETIKAALATRNQADGPQFYIENDPRLTRVGRFIRKANIDEIPQFFNVLVGHMSIVGPRPSPRRENQFCPGWREARLSVRPGITGLWQVNRTRIRGADFQEWIKYDVEYVENQSWGLDLRIIFKTIKVLFKGFDSP
jgi:lipopolysaccharide/colanic/teichoic acid biosynthesis glycosyltransferase